jgi:hypothetical protein
MRTYIRNMFNYGGIRTHELLICLAGTMTSAKLFAFTQGLKTSDFLYMQILQNKYLLRSALVGMLDQLIDCSLDMLKTG